MKAPCSYPHAGEGYFGYEAALQCGRGVQCALGLPCPSGEGDGAGCGVILLGDGTD